LIPEIIFVLQPFLCLFSKRRSPTMSYPQGLDEADSIDQVQVNSERTVSICAEWIPACQRLELQHQHNRASWDFDRITPAHSCFQEGKSNSYFLIQNISL
jgi:hypothetical protein